MDSNFTNQSDERKINPDLDLFNNPHVQAARAKLTPEQIKAYEMIGELMYGPIDFENSEIIEQRGISEEEAFQQELRYAEVGLRSGLNPLLLTEKEKEILARGHGKKWWKNFGYAGETLDEALAI